MQSRLRKYYYRLLFPAGGVSVIVLGCRALGLINPLPLLHDIWLSAAVFILACIPSVAGPIMLRAVFAHRMREANRTPEEDFYRFQKRLIWMMLPAVYLASMTGLAELPRFFHAGILLSALYAAYYQYPSQRRIASDQRVFRVDHGLHACQN